MLTSFASFFTLRDKWSALLALLICCSLSVGCSSAKRQSIAIPTAEIEMEIEVLRVADGYTMDVQIRDTGSASTIGSVSGLPITLGADEELAVVTNSRTIVNTIADDDFSRFQLLESELPGTIKIELRRGNGRVDALENYFTLERTIRVITPVSGQVVPYEGTIDFDWALFDANGVAVDVPDSLSGAVKEVCGGNALDAPGFDFNYQTDANGMALPTAAPVRIDLSAVRPDSFPSATLPCDAQLLSIFEEVDFGESVIYDPLLANDSSAVNDDLFQYNFSNVPIELQ